jgi:hypothetical protein
VRTHTLLICILFLLAGTLVACSQTREVTFQQLSANPQKFSGKTITIEGFYFQGFESNLLCENLKYSGYAPEHLVPDGEIIWINGGIPKDIYDSLPVQQVMGPTERYGKLRVTGKFEYGGKYGHLGGFSSQITVSNVVLLEWSGGFQ